MTFDISKFAVSNSQQQSTVKEFEISETSPITFEDIQVVAGDTFTVIALTSLMLMPSAVCIWYNTNIPFMYLSVISLMVIGVMGLSRYDHNTRVLRVRTTSGRIAWEQIKTSDKTSQKAEVRFFRDGSNNQPTTTSVIKSSLLSIDQMTNLAIALVNSGKFTQDIVTKAARISAQSYQNLASDLMSQGLISFKGESAKQGYKITNLGYQLFGQMSDGHTPLLADPNENAAKMD